MKWTVISKWSVMSLIAYFGCIVAANWMITHLGSVQIDGAWFLPVLPGVLAPSGAYLAGVSFAARDAVQRSGGRALGVFAVLAGALLSSVTSSPDVAVASGVTLLLAESVDFAVYTPLAERRFVAAVLASGAVASVVDSVVFLWLARIPMSPALPGLLVAKLYMVLLGGSLALVMRQRLPAIA